jgi:hypothetical protein
LTAFSAADRRVVERREQLVEAQAADQAGGLHHLDVQIRVFAQ